MTPQEVLRRRLDIATSDPKVAHEMEWQLWYDVLQSIAEDDASKHTKMALAREALMFASFPP